MCLWIIYVANSRHRYKAVEVKTVKDGGIVEWVKEAAAPAPAAATNGKSPAKSADTPKKEDPKTYKKTKINEE